jgi:hypothetical protein
MASSNPARNFPLGSNPAAPGEAGVTTRGAERRRFASAIGGLAIALLLALVAASLTRKGRYEVGLVLGALSLAIAIFEAFSVARNLRRRSAFEGWEIKIEYELTRGCGLSSDHRAHHHCLDQHGK